MNIKNLGRENRSFKTHASGYGAAEPSILPSPTNPTVEGGAFGSGVRRCGVLDWKARAMIPGGVRSNVEHFYVSEV